MHLCQRGRIAKGNTAHTLLPLSLCHSQLCLFPLNYFLLTFSSFLPHILQLSLSPSCFSLIFIKLHHLFLLSFPPLLHCLYIWLPLSPSTPLLGHKDTPPLSSFSVFRIPPPFTVIGCLPPLALSLLPSTPTCAAVYPSVSGVVVVVEGGGGGGGRVVSLSRH